MNSRPAAYKAAALPAELWWRNPPNIRARKSISRGTARFALKIGNRGQAFIPKPPAPSIVVDPLPCPNCGSALTLLGQYERHFCYRCGQYAPEGYGDNGARTCANCAGILSYVASYARFYCYKCNVYASGESPRTAAGGPTPSPTTDVPAPASSTEPGPVPVAKSSGETASSIGLPRTSPPEPEPPVPEEAPPEERPPLTREGINEAKKANLLDLCKAYNLNPSGTKEQLRERLLSYLAEQEGMSRAIETEEASDREELSPVLPHVAPSPEETPVSEPVSSEPEEDQPAGGTVVLLREPPGTASYGTAMDSELSPSIPPVQDAVTETPEEVSRDDSPTGPAQAPLPIVSPRIDHPCPACGRELDFIEQYGRWYCHGCKAYAPTKFFRHVCPTCGSTLRWIDRYARWWCDQEQRYAPADLPPPSGAGTAAIASTIVQAQGAPVAVADAHRHRSPSAGIGVAAVGLVMWVAYEAAIEVPQVMGLPPPIVLSPEVGLLLRFLGLLFLGVGLIAGLASARHRR